MKVTRANGNLVELQTLILMFRDRHQRLPTAEEGLAVVMRPPSKSPPTAQRKPLRDPWGRDYRYEALPGAQGYRLRSLGPDKKSPADDIILTWPNQPTTERTPAP